MKLNAKTVARLTLPDGKDDHIEFDDDLPGFGFRIRRSGNRVRKTWIAQYRASGRTRRMTKPAEVLSAEQAQAWAKKVLAKAALGEDPQADKAARRQQDGHTLKAIAGMFLAARQPSVRSKTFRELNRYLTRPYFKPLHAMPVGQITRRDVALCLTKITAENGSVTAARARSALSSLYVWVMGQGLSEANPVVGTIKPKDSKPRERVLSNSELVAIWRACGDDDFGKIVKLLVLTGCRKMEICGLRWSELDLENGILRLPGERTKNRRPHALPLPPMVLDIIATVPRMVGRDHLFGERSDHGFTQLRAKRDLDARLGGKVAEWTLHDLRRSCATGMADIGVQPHIIEVVLNHVSGHKAGVAGTYNRSVYEREVKAALAMRADHVRALVEGGEKKVVQLRA
jgi:integrase